MGTEGISTEQLARWSPTLRESVQADEAVFQRLLDDRAVDGLSYDEMRAICAEFAAVDPVTGTKVRSGTRPHDSRYRSAWERIRRFQTLETIREWDDEEMRRTREFTERARALASHTPMTRKEARAAQAIRVPQRHRRYNAAPGGRSRYA